MRILVLAPRLPWPPLDGGRVAMSRLAESLAAAGAAVEVLSLNPRKHRGVAAGPVPVEAVDIDTSRRVRPALRALSGSTPYIVTRFESDAFRDAVRKSVRRFAPDVVQIESPFLLQYADAIREESGARVTLRSLNVEFRLWEGLAGLESNRLRRFALRRVASSLRDYEVREMEKLDAIVPITEADAKDFRALGVTRPMHVVPCGVAPGRPSPNGVDEGTVAFIGALDFLPNQNAVRWILDELWPRVTGEQPGAQLSIAGSSPPAWLLQRVREQNIALQPNVDDATEFVRDKSVLIAPLFAGGGMRVKVLEAMAHGKAVVATTIGAGGIEVENGRDIVIEDDARSFANAVVRLLRDPAAAAEIGAAARATVEHRYDNNALGRDLLRFYESL